MRVLFSVLATIVIALVSGEARAYAPGDCERAGYLEAFAPGLLRERCVLLGRYDVNFDGRTVQISVIRREDDGSGDDAAWMVRAEQLARRLGPALESMGGLRLLPVTVLLANFAEPDPDERYGPAHAEARVTGYESRIADTECPIIFYKQSEPISLDEFIFTYSHEVFHCVQASTFWTRYRVASSAWWSEASAEYFAFLTAPASRAGDVWFPEFARQSHAHSMLDLQYENVVFFLWLAGARGPSGVRELMARMPETDGQPAQLAALQSVVPMDAWLNFTKAFMDGVIPIPGGRRVPGPGYPPESYIVDSPADHTFATSAYRLLRTQFEFSEGKSYDVEMHALADDPRTLFSDHPSGGWAPPPATVNACAEPKIYRTVTTSVDGPADHQIAITEARELDQRACCLIGDWTPTHETLVDTALLANRIGNELAATRGAPAPQCSHAGGDWRLSFHADGSGGVFWNAFTNECKMVAPRGEIITRGVWNGALEFDWDIVERNVGRARYTENTATNAVTTSFGPMTTPPQIIPLAGPSSGNFEFQCSEIELTVNGLYSLGPHSRHTPAE